MCPEPLTRRLRTTGPREGAAGDSGWKIKAEKIRARRAERTQPCSLVACVWRGRARAGQGVRLCLEVMEAETQSQRPTGASQRQGQGSPNPFEPGVHI